MGPFGIRVEGAVYYIMIFPKFMAITELTEYFDSAKYLGKSCIGFHKVQFSWIFLKTPCTKENVYYYFFLICLKEKVGPV